MGTGKGKTRLLGGRYRLIAPVEQEGTNVMWRAHDSLLRRDVAIKEIRPKFREHGADLRDARRRALREARSAGRLNHPAVISVHDLLEESQRLWIVMELLETHTLKETVQRLSHLSVRRTAWIGLRLLGGLRHAHGAGVLHRDINPGSILLTGDRVVLSDFGLAALNGNSSISTTGPTACTPGYMAPERLRGLPATPAGDLWSLGASLYFAVEGRPPYSATDELAALGMKTTRDLRPALRAGPLHPVLEGLLQCDPAVRISARRAVRMLSEIPGVKGTATTAPPPRLPTTRRPPNSFT
jgi:serine/threonine protein kinase